MNKKKMMELVLYYVNKGYEMQDLRDSGEIDGIEDEEDEQYGEYFYECKELGTITFRKKIDSLDEPAKTSTPSKDIP